MFSAAGDFVDGELIFEMLVTPVTSEEVGGAGVN